MALKVNFNLKDSKSKTPTSILLVFVINKKRFKLYTEEKIKPNLNVFPNPTNNVLNVNSTNLQNLKFTVYSVDGDFLYPYQGFVRPGVTWDTVLGGNTSPDLPSDWKTVRYNFEENTVTSSNTTWTREDDLHTYSPALVNTYEDKRKEMKVLKFF